MSNSSMKRSLAGAAMALLLAAGLVACGNNDPAPPPEPTADETTTPSVPDEENTDAADPDSETDETGESEEPQETPSPDTTTPTANAVKLPTDCRAILSQKVLDQLKDVPLNHANFGPSGVLADGSLRCVWAHPSADTTGLTTEITRMNRGPALDFLNGLMKDEGFTCYQPDEGTRCEKTWQNEMYPVTDGRTLYWRDGVLIDTRYSNLAPSGYTASIAASLFGS